MQTGIGTGSIYILKLNNQTIRFDPLEVVNKVIADTVKLKTYNIKGNNNYMSHTYELPVNIMQITKETPDYTVVFQMSNINFDRPKKGRPVVTAADGKYLIKIK